MKAIQLEKPQCFRALDVADPIPVLATLLCIAVLSLR